MTSLPPSSKLWLRAAAGLSIYLALVLAPLVLAWRTPELGFWREASAACAWAGLAILTLEFVLITRIHMLTGPFGQDALLRFHRHAGIVGSGLVLAHPLLLAAREGLPVLWLIDPLASGSAAVGAGTGASLALLVLMVSTLGRRRLLLDYEIWLLLHRWLALLVLALGLGHAFSLGVRPGNIPLLLLWIAYLALAVGALVWYRGVRPWRQRQPWIVLSNTPERGRSRTIRLRAAGHPGFAFQAGQFCWLRQSGPWAIEAHPVSMSSPAPRGAATELAFTIKDLGDWSGQVVPQLAPGDQLWLDGPYGVFTLERHDGPGFVLIGGGVGVSPFVSMVETQIERGDERPLFLFHAAHDRAGLTGSERFTALSRTAPQFRWVPVLEAGPVAVGEESGWVTAAILWRHLPPNFREFQFFVCGPAPMMDWVERELRQLGLARAQVHTERFDLV